MEEVCVKGRKGHHTEGSSMSRGQVWRYLVWMGVALSLQVAQEC